jgi:hypothetical protein
MKIIAAIEYWKNQGKYDELGMSYGERLILFKDFKVRCQKIGSSRNGKVIDGKTERYQDLKILKNTISHDDPVNYWIKLYAAKPEKWRRLTDKELKVLKRREGTITPINS